MSEPILYRYKPREGEFITGLPKRDLTAADVACVAPWDLRNGVASGLYEPVAETEPETPEVESDPPADSTEETEPVAETEPEGRRARR